MALAHQFVKEIERVTQSLVEGGIVDDQNYPYLRDSDGFKIVESDYWRQDGATNGLLRTDLPYEDLYLSLKDQRAYDLKFLDGALIQLRFEFDGTGRNLIRSRCAFLPSPNLTPYRRDPDLYEEMELNGEVVAEHVVTVPIRFDFDSRSGVVTDVVHPASHVTLGQYSDCRIPATAAITPHHFADLIVRGFYHSEGLGKYGLRAVCSTDPTITTDERTIVHFGIP